MTRNPLSVCAARGGTPVTSRSRTFRAAAIGVTLAAVSATFATVTVAQASPQAPAGTVDRHDPAPVHQREHDLDGPLSKTRKPSAKRP